MIYRNEREALAREMRQLADELEAVGDEDRDTLVNLRCQLIALSDQYNAKTDDVWREYCREVREEHEAMIRQEREIFEADLDCGRRQGLVLPLFNRRRGRT